MKFAIIDGQRNLAQPNLSGECPCCGRPVVAKCGEVRVNHWAHKRSHKCDHWWETETEWHRNWKDRFPLHWQEFVHEAENGERHIADVKTDHNWVIEFQHSYLKPEERRSRDAFYSKLIWVVDGTRRQRDVEHFRSALSEGIRINPNTQVWRVLASKSMLLKEWADCPSQVFLDFGGESVVWWLLAKRPGGPFYVGPFSRPEFVRIHLGTSEEDTSAFEKLVGDLGGLVSNYERHLQHKMKRASVPGVQYRRARRVGRRRF